MPDAAAVSWGGPLSKTTAVSSLPDGVIIPASSPLIGGPLRDRYAASLPGSPSVDGLPCLRVDRIYYTSLGEARSVGSPTVVRLRTDAPVIEIAGATADNSFSAQTLIVDGRLAPPKILSSSLGRSGWNLGTLRIDFGSRAMRDIWIETALAVAHFKVGPYDLVEPVLDSNEPQMTVVGDSYLQSRSPVFGNGAAIALELGARLGLRNIAVDAIGGTGFWNVGGGKGNANDRLPAHAEDGSFIYLVMLGLNDYGSSAPDGRLEWPTRAQYEESVFGYLLELRRRRPESLIVVTTPFCPVPPMSDSSYVANPGTNDSGEGDFLYKARILKEAISQVAPPWVFIDVLMGGGWLNSSGVAGDITGLQWFTGGTPASGTSEAYKPGNTNGGGGGGFGGIARVPVVRGGRYSQAPELVASGGSGNGLLLFCRIDWSSGALTSIEVVCPGSGYTPVAGLPSIHVDSTFELEPAEVGAPVLVEGVNADGEYPLQPFAPSGAVRADLNNIYTLLSRDMTHPSPVGVAYISRRLARNLYDAVLSL